MLRCQAVDERERVARHLLHAGRAPAHVLFHSAGRQVLESVRTRVLVRERGAHPRLHVAHLPLELLPALQLPELRQRLLHLVDGVAEGGGAVAERRRRPGVGGAGRAVGEEGHVGGGAAGAAEADGDGDDGELARALLDRVGVARQGGVAASRIERGAAARTDEIRAVVVAIWWMDGWDCENDRWKEEEKKARGWI